MAPRCAHSYIITCLRHTINTSPASYPVSTLQGGSKVHTSVHCVIYHQYTLMRVEGGGIFLPLCETTLPTSVYWEVKTHTLDDIQSHYGPCRPNSPSCTRYRHQILVFQTLLLSRNLSRRPPICDQEYKHNTGTSGYGGSLKPSWVQNGTQDRRTVYQKPLLGPPR